MTTPQPVILRWIAFGLYCIAWLLLWIAVGSNSYLHSKLETRYNFGFGSTGAYRIPMTLGGFEVCAHIQLLNYDLSDAGQPVLTDCSRIPSGCTTDVFPFGEGDVALPLNYRDSCSTFHAFQAFLILAGLECTLLPFLLAAQLLAHRFDAAQRLVDLVKPSSLYRAGLALPGLVFVTAILSLVCLPTTVDDNWAQVCADILSFNNGSGDGFDLCDAPDASWGASFDCHVTAVVLIAIGLTCYTVAWVQETKTTVGGGAYSESLNVNHHDSDRWGGDGI